MNRTLDLYCKGSQQSSAEDQDISFLEMLMDGTPTSCGTGVSALESGEGEDVHQEN